MDDIEVDPIIPRAKGESGKSENSRALHRYCHI